MRKDASRALHKSTIRSLAIILLASAVTGCSSDVSRFAGYLSSSDNITTSSISQDDARLTPPQNVSAGNQYQVPVQPRVATDSALNQPMPAPTGSTGNIYDNITTGTVVQRQALPSPTGQTTGKRQVLPKERPLVQSSASVQMPDPVKTGTTPRAAKVKVAQKSTGNTKVALNNTLKAPVPSKAPAHKKVVAAAKLQPGSGTYTVVAGDNLGRIAAQNGTTVAALRDANGLANDTIRIGQTLRMPGSSVQSAKPSAKVVTASAEKKVDTIKTSTTPKTYTPPVKKVSLEQAEKQTEVAATAPQTTGIGKYRWPARGAIIAGYGANVDGERNDGIDISLPEGSAVKAAENGVVIYSGDGLKKLGNTVLVRHSDGKVTVYAHLKELDVQRGDKVRRGQQIASSGMTGSASRPKLHFEVRKDSAPVNPVTFLE